MRLISDLYPICRSITGNGFRDSLRILAAHVELDIHEVPSGTRVLDWTVPNEWNIRAAYLADRRGNRIVDFKDHNLHVVNYSVPIRRRLTLSELQPHLHSLADAPNWIPYRTSYYKEDWGFCLTHHQLETVTEPEYDVFIDSTLEPGHLTYGEYYLPGQTHREVLFSIHSCHPSLCNDNLSGMAIATRLASLLGGLERRYSYRFLWIPGTIGAITWLALHQFLLPRIKHGLVLSCLGDPGAFTYKRSRRGNAEIDQVVEYSLRGSGQPVDVRDFSPTGYDERQYCSPGFDLPIGCFMRTPNGEYPQYHTSADNLAFVSADALGESLRQLLRVIAMLETNRRYQNQNPKGEPQLGRRGLFKLLGGSDPEHFESALLWTLNFSDGCHSLLDIANQSQIDFDLLLHAADQLLSAQLLRPIDDGTEQ